MDLSEAVTHSFVVKVWTDGITEQGERTVWRGHITHVPSGRRRYVEDLDAIANFVADCLEQMGVVLGVNRRVRRWLKRRARA